LLEYIVVKTKLIIINKEKMAKETIQTAPLEKGDLVATMKTTN